MSERRLRFGDVVRVDPEKNPRVKQPDDRRWMIVAPRAGRQMWTLMYLAPAYGGTTEVSHWASMYGFCLADPE